MSFVTKAYYSYTDLQIQFGASDALYKVHSLKCKEYFCNPLIFRISYIVSHSD